ncbi:MAG: hypothetical protein AAGG02_08745 [Cyanobacteria bacterium P01_H01_bin.15]
MASSRPPRVDWLVLLALVLTLSFWMKPAIAQRSTQSLSSEVFSLRRRVTQLETEVRSLRSQNLTARTAPSLAQPSTPTPVIGGAGIGPSDPLFARLSILVIELKERIVVLETQTTDLQARLDGQLENAP